MIQPKDIENLIKTNYPEKVERDDLGLTGEYILSAKDVLDIFIDLNKLEGAKLLAKKSLSSGYGGELKQKG